MTIEQHAEAAAEEIDRSMTDGPKAIIAKHMQAAIDEATAQVRESRLRAARQDAELWDFIQQSHESICEAAGVECILDDAMVDLVPVAVGAINKLRARIAELEGLGPLIEELGRQVFDAAFSDRDLGTDSAIAVTKAYIRNILKGGA